MRTTDHRDAGPGVGAEGVAQRRSATVGRRPAAVSRRRVLGTAVAAPALALGAASCSTGGDKSKKLYFWNGLVGDDGPYMQKIIKAYNETDPEYPVVFQPMAGGDLTTKIYSVLQTGQNIPDLVIQDQFIMATLQDQGAIGTMEPFIEQQPNLGKDSFLPEAWENCIIDDEVFGIPLYLFSEVLYYNKELLKKYGAEDLLEDGFITIDDIKSLKGKLPKDTYALAQQNLPWAIMSLFYSGGGELEEGMKDMTSAPWRNAIQALKELYDEGLMAPIDADGEQLFGSGKALFAILGTWSQGNMKETLGEEKVGLTNTLQMDTASPANFFYQQNWIQLKDETRPPERTAAAAQFIEFVRKNWMMWAATGSISPNMDDIENPDYGDYLQSVYTRDDKEKSLIATSNYVYGGYATAGWETFNDIIYGKISMEKGLRLLDQQTQGQIQIQEQAK